MEILMIDFLNPNFYDVSDIPADAPNKALLVELYQRMNEQNERLWMFFTEMTEDPGHVTMKNEFIKPRQHRASYKKRKAKAMKAREEKEVDESGYKAFLKEEGFTDLI